MKSLVSYINENKDKVYVVKDDEGIIMQVCTTPEAAEEAKAKLEKESSIKYTVSEENYDDYVKNA